MNDTPPNSTDLIELAQRVSSYVLALFTILLALFLSLHKVENLDIGWLLGIGQYIFENHHVPRIEVFSYVAEGNPYIESHWLFELLLFAWYRLAGISGLTVLMMAVLTATFAVTYSIGYDAKKFVVTSACMIAGIIVASPRFIVRAELVSMLFLATYFCILERHRRRGTKLIYILPLVQLLWVNMQGLFVLGLILPLPYLFFGLLETRVRLPWQRKDEAKPRAAGLKPLAIVYAIMVGAIFLNPYGTDLALYPLTLLREISHETAVAAVNVAEFLPSLRSPDLNRAENYLKWMIYLGSFSFALNIRRLNLTHLSLFGAFLYLALTAQRNVAVFAIIATPITIININSFLDELSERLPRLNLPHYIGMAQVVVTPLILAGIVFMLVQITTNSFYIRDRNMTRFGFGLAKHNYPIKAANFIDAADLGGRMFNNPWCGGYLIWRFHPERKVYFDGRWEVYGEEFFEHYLRLQNDPVLFEEEAARYGVHYVLLFHTVGYVDDILIGHLIDSPEWEPVYFDEVSVVFVRNMPEYADLIQKYRIDFNTFERERKRFEAALPAGLDDTHFQGTDGLLARLTDKIPGVVYPFDDISRANFYVKIGYYETARQLFERALRVYPDAEVAHSGLGVAYWKLGMYAFAMAEFKVVEQLNPHSVSTLINLGQLNLVIGTPDEAKLYFEKAKKLDRRNIQPSLYLAGVYLRQKQPGEAANELRHVLKLQPDLKEAQELLQRIEQR